MTREEAIEEIRYYCADSEEIIKALEQEPKTGLEVYDKDTVAWMFRELQLEIEELKNEPHCCEHYVRGINNSSNVIQQKIDALKAESEDCTSRESVEAIPRERIEQMVAEIEKEAAESVYPECASLYWALDVINKYTKEQVDNTRPYYANEWL